MADMFYHRHNGRTHVVDLIPGVYKGRRCFTVRLGGRHLRVEGDRPEQVIPQLQALLARAPWED